MKKLIILILVMFLTSCTVNNEKRIIYRCTEIDTTETEYVFKLTRMTDDLFYGKSITIRSTSHLYDIDDTIEFYKQIK